MRLSSLDMFKYNKTEPFFFKFVSPIFNIGFLQKFSLLTARSNRSCPGGEIFRIWTRGNNIFFPVKWENNRKTIFIWTALYKRKSNYEIIKNTEMSYLQNLLVLSLLSRIPFWFFFRFDKKWEWKNGEVYSFLIVASRLKKSNDWNLESSFYFILFFVFLLCFCFHL